MKILSVSPSRVPPDQSGTVSPAAISARSASLPRSARVTWVSRVPTVNVSTTAAALGEAVGEAEQRVGVPAHRTGHVHQKDDAARLVPAPPPGDLRGLAHLPQAGAQRARRVDGAAVPALVSRGTPARGPRPQRGEQAASRAFSAADIEATSRCRSTSVSLAIARTTGSSDSPSPSPSPSASGSPENVGDALLGRPRPGQPVAGVEVRLVHLVVAGQVVGRGAERGPARDVRRRARRRGPPGHRGQEALRRGPG